ncbi:capsular polysaccharide biosynthesis protein [Aquabacterium sp. A7-Y]|uniref:capsular polysaccharide biosynthesis protein n=1 Tax=Aquabacterium sp. A7-Y TaxID=1349605 RepID=UPI00223D5D1D|nr:capsular polysaccharide biosynthesis protein [Aquabacterium sp. A7-Y]MCW7538924.1 capsular polysaccharide biosynthesis protein [Aquabacterium sp. A7-Y]
MRSPSRILAAVSSGVRGIATLPSLLDDCRVVSHRHPVAELTGVLAWGRKPSAEKARRVGERHGLPTWYLEDGFIRSVRLGSVEPPLSIVLDDQGIYYDATGPSRVERLIAAVHSEAQLQRAASIRSLWCSVRLSKYNHARELPPPMAGPYVLAIDQTFGDASIRYGLADVHSFQRMLEAALDEHPQLPVILKVHPDVISGRKRGHFSALSPGQASRVTLLASDAHPPSLLEPAHAVYCVTSQMGFEGLLWGKPVRTFGMPFYAGWGLTGDELQAPERRRTGHHVKLEELVHAALIEYPRYLDPETLQRCEPERLLEWMGLQRRMRERFPAQVHAIGFSHWKRPIVRAFFSGSRVSFVPRAADAPAGATLAVWGRREAPTSPSSPAEGEATVSGAGRTPHVIRLEDGFIRSVGLGADLVRPLSWVMDGRGIYYDATAPSDLEHLLQNEGFDAALIERARVLRERIAASGVTKYNVGTGAWTRPPGAKRVVLVPGQVESDASITYGALGLRSNMALLGAARKAAPDAHLIYKPHPDVVAKLRKQGQGEDRAALECDEVVVDVPMHALLDAVDEVHVLTSLAGFEALLRGKAVVCHGAPFYAGWGLTHDMLSIPRRSRRLTLDELVAGVLILYPAYVSRTTRAFTTPERALDELLAWRAAGPGTLPPWRKVLRWLLSWRSR